MTETIEAAGAFATAATAAHALDPPAAAHATAHSAACPNCGAATAGRYCAACGQATHLHRSLLHAAEELVHGVFHFDSKLWNTLPLLVARPGKLTRDYVMGKRARYIAPVALFLLTLFLMFLVMGLSGGPKVDSRLVPAAALAEAEREIAKMDRDLAAIAGDPARAQDAAALKAARALAQSGLEELKARAAGQPGRSGSTTIGAAIEAAIDAGGVKVDSGDPGRDAKILSALRDPEFLFYKMKQSGYKLSFLLVPLSLPWLILLFFWKKGVHLYDHVVFLLYSISFMSILFIIGTLAANVGLEWGPFYGLLFFVVPPLHLFAQLKEAYALGWASAMWRTVVLVSGALLTLALYFVGILLMGLLD